MSPKDRGQRCVNRSEREEGEISPSDNDDQPSCPVVASIGPFVNPVGAFCKVITEKVAQGNQPGVPSIKSSDFQPLLAMHPESQKKFKKKEVLSKLGSLECGGPSDADTNLVISFSNEDSSSESDMEGRKLPQRPEMTGLVPMGRPPSAPVLNSMGSRKTGRAASQPVPKNLPSSRISSGAPHGMSSKPITIDQHAQSRNSNIVKRNPAEHCSDQSVDLNNNKLHDLRRQIALWENKLKYQHKAVQGVKGNLGQKIDAGQKVGAVSVDNSLVEPKEPDGKRRKVGGSYSSRPALNENQPPTLKNPILERGKLSDGRKVDYSLPKATLSRKEPTEVNLKDSNGNANGKVVCNASRNAITISDVNAEDENVNSSTVDKSTRSENLDCRNVEQIQQRLSSNSVSENRHHRNNLFVNRGLEAFNEDQQTFLAPYSDLNLWNGLASKNDSGCDGGNMQALIGLEDSLDKALEEAQEWRYSCEIGERNAFKAYRKSQWSLMEANARCAELYRKRELLSAHLRSWIMDNPRSLSMYHEGRAGCDALDGLTNNARLPDHELHQKHCNSSGRDYDQSISFANCILDSATDLLPGQNLGLEPVSEPDASTSEGLPHSYGCATARVKAMSIDPIFSPNENQETFVSGHDLMQHKNEDKRKGKKGEGTCANEKVSVNVVKDPLLLEATLRSELFAKLCRREESKRDYMIDRKIDDEVASENAQIGNETSNLTEAVDAYHNHLRGIKGPKNVSEVSVDDDKKDYLAKSSSKFHSSTDMVLHENSAGTPVSLLSPYTLCSIFSHMKTMSLYITSLDLEDGALYVSHSPFSDESKWDAFIASSDSPGEDGSYSTALELDPFWPLCMYELRGKCNNDECQWQHFKDFCVDRLPENGSISAGADGQHGISLHQRTRNCVGSFSQCSPTYLVNVDIMRIDSRAYLLARKHWQRWCRCFSISIASSHLLQKGLPEDAQVVDGSECRIEVNASWGTESSYFGSKNGITSPLKQSLDAAGRPLEMALVILDQEKDNVKSIRKALAVLSRGLEADPTSEILWIIYLLVYYSSRTQSPGKDDLFSCAVKYNKESYGLWLMYINSRRQLDDRLGAYEDALSALCSRKSASESDGSHASACILDLFMQMINCLCMSGHVEKAIQRICGLLPGEAISDDSHLLLLSDILTHLMFSDKCIFWVCCVYLVIYRRLPDAVMQQLEFEKELHEIEWPLVDLVHVDTQRVRKLLETSLKSVESSVNYQNDSHLRSAHCFALCHLRCVVALDGLSSYRELLGRYIRLYPSCLELRLIEMRMEQNSAQDLGFDRFEQILSSWPKESPGIEVIWNQYAEYALQLERYDFLKELMVRWFESFKGNGMDIDSCTQKLNPSKGTAPYKVDVVFGFLNLSLYHLLNNKQNEAHLAIDRALTAASREHVLHCAREHATFMLTHCELVSKAGFTINHLLTKLNGYLVHASSLPGIEPLSRKFIDDIERPRLRQLANNLLNPICLDFRMVNLVLEAWYGPSLLPGKLLKRRDMVDYVEAILDLVPSNFPLVISVCKQLLEENSNTGILPSGIQFWACSNLVTTLCHAHPIPPENIWVNAASILSSVAASEVITEKFYKKAFLVYPFSVKLWQVYYQVCRSRGDTSTVTEAAREKGIKID